MFILNYSHRCNIYTLGRGEAGWSATRSPLTPLYLAHSASFYCIPELLQVFELPVAVLTENSNISKNRGKIILFLLFNQHQWYFI
ncbi:hypothetical protein MBAV_003287 [Candidatus Magnetobacterium bavaricum]|uniref:Uncharacterized protein n=1 Tax=Candidatus Magnetobacterium bavaricum TaxID=29290 RepID=A0A0F3GRD8_9BACT|nr:hypothetical protein MBAV_003287 [Candidatus Magnetobacterium bavaricum]